MYKSFAAGGNVSRKHCGALARMDVCMMLWGLREQNSTLPGQHSLFIVKVILLRIFRYVLEKGKMTLNAWRTLELQLSTERKIQKKAATCLSVSMGMAHEIPTISAAQAQERGRNQLRISALVIYIHTYIHINHSQQKLGMGHLGHITSPLHVTI